MDNKIDLDDIILRVIHEKTGIKDNNLKDAWISLWMLFDPEVAMRKTKDCMKEAIRQALDLASEKARCKGSYKTNEGYLAGGGVDKQSILDVNDLVI